MLPKQNRPRSSSGPKFHAGWGPFASSSRSSAEDLPTTPLPVASAQFDQKDTAILPARRTPLPPALLRQLSRPGVTRQLSSPGITRQLSNAGLVEGVEGAPARSPMLIKGGLKKRTADPVPPRVHKKRRLLITMSGVLMLALFALVALLGATPLGHDVGWKFGSLPVGNTLSSSSGNTLSLISQATATAVSHQQSDGYDPYSNGSVTITDGSGSLNWPVGQCTYWANYRYHELTGYWVSWTGNAAQWVAGARAAGWNVSSSPHVPSIIVLMPYVQGAWGYGHVAVVESVNDTVTPEVVHTSNMNWWVNGGGWDKVSYYDFTVGSGVYFVWHK